MSLQKKLQQKDQANPGNRDGKLLSKEPGESKQELKVLFPIVLAKANACLKMKLNKGEGCYRPLSHTIICPQKCHFQKLATHSCTAHCCTQNS